MAKQQLASNESEAGVPELTATVASAELALRAEIAPELWPDRELSGVTHKSTYTKTRKWRSFTFDASFADAASATIVLTYGADTDVRRVFRRYYGDKTDVTKKRPAGRACYAENAGCLAEVFPSDWKLATLLDALEPASILPLLPGATEGADVDAAGFSAHAFRFKAHRRSLIRYAIGAGSERREYIGKLFTADDRAEHGWNVLSYLHDAAATRDLVPAPVAYDQALQLLIMERMPGVMMSEVLMRKRDDVAPVIRSAAKALANLHSLRLGDDQPRTLATEFGKIEERFDSLGDGVPDLADSMRAIVASLRAREVEAIKDAGYCFVHGDFNPRQLLVDGDDTRVVDLDGGCLGDPAVDVGRFMAALHVLVVEQRATHLLPAAELFLAAYERESGRVLRERATSVMVLRMLYRCERLLLMPAPQNLAHARALIADAHSAISPPTKVAIGNSVAVLAGVNSSVSAPRSLFEFNFLRPLTRMGMAAAHFFAVLIGME